MVAPDGSQLSLLALAAGQATVADAPITYDGKLDGPRLARLEDLVRTAMRDGAWRTLGELQARCGHTEGGIGARIRQLRGMGYTMERRRRGDPKQGLWEYRYGGKREGMMDF